jgi:thioesterase domain-containing protein
MGSATALNQLRQSLSNVTWRETLGKEKAIVVPLNAHGARIPFFCVHSLTGKATDYVPLAQKLGPEQPFFSLQIPPANRTPDYGGLIAPLSIAAIAAHYVKEIAALRPTGPIALGGWSIGAIIALEMAQQLRRHGRAVAQLVIIDMIPWNCDFPPNTRMVRALDTLLHSATWLASHQLVKDGLKTRQILARGRIKLAWFKARIGGNPLPPKEEVVGDLVDVARYAPAHVALMEQLFAAGQVYVPARYDGPVQVYAARSEVALNHLARLRWGWRHIAPRSRICAQPGAHQTLFNAADGQGLAAHLGARLAALTDA